MSAVSVNVHLNTLLGAGGNARLHLVDGFEPARSLFATANSSGPGSVSSGLEARPFSLLKRANLDSQVLVTAIVLATSCFITCILISFILRGGNTDEASSNTLLSSFAI